MSFLPYIFYYRSPPIQTYAFQWLGYGQTIIRMVDSISAKNVYKKPQRN